jgi:hypothetical protein
MGKGFRGWYILIAIGSLLVISVAAFAVWVVHGLSKGYEGQGEVVQTLSDAESLPPETEVLRLFWVDDGTVRALHNKTALRYVLLSQGNGRRGTVGPEAAKTLAELPNLKQLLIVDAPEVSVEFVRALSASRSLMHLSFEGCPNVKADAIACLQHLVSLKRLHIFQSLDLESVAALAGLTHLDGLYLQVAASDLNSFPTLSALGQLTTLSVDVMNASELQAARLEEKLSEELPGCRVRVSTTDP